VEIADLLSGPESVLACVKASGKKSLLAELAAKAAPLFKLDERRLFDRLLERERLGSTGIGGGIAIPHGRMLASTSRWACSPGLAIRSISTRSTSARSIPFSFCSPRGCGCRSPQGAGARVAPVARSQPRREAARHRERRRALRLAGRDPSAQSAA
jgi:PTS system nitrogen regulatory IIA component